MRVILDANGPVGGSRIREDSRARWHLYFVRAWARRRMELFVVTATEPHPDLLPILSSQGLRPQVIKTEGSDGYFNFLSDQWAKGKNFISIEGDILPWPGAVQQLEECTKPWCGHAYRLDSGYLAAFGLVKFRSELMAQAPDVMNRVTDRRWESLDNRVRWLLMERLGIDAHQHWPPVIHTNPKYLAKPADPPRIPVISPPAQKGNIVLRMPAQYRACTALVSIGYADVQFEVGPDLLVYTDDEDVAKGCEVLGAIRL
jgi:hypothetical protein